MAWRIHDHVLRGEVDNRTRGFVRGRVWLAGVPEPLTLELAGDCHPDLAGCLLTFENPAALPMTTRPPAAPQRGTAGDITAARKVRVFDVPLEEALAMLKRGETPPEHMANSIYVEWFSDLCGRMVIESADYRLEISEPTWRFTAEEIAERQRLTQEAHESFAEEIPGEDPEENWDEFRSEQLLRESDLIGEKYRQLLEKYANHPDGERLIAHEMGWTWLEEALNAEAGTDAEAEESEEEDLDDDGLAAGELEEEPPNPAREGIDWVRDSEEGLTHPVAKRVRTALYTLLEELRAGDEDLAETDPAIGEFVGHFMTLHVKLASALTFIARADRTIDPGMIIAWLKRALEIHNQTLAAAAALHGHPKFGAAKLARHRDELFQVREGILTVIARLRNGAE